MKLYTRILKSYYSIFNKEFKISGFIKVDDNFEEVQFDPKLTVNYTVFLIKRIV